MTYGFFVQQAILVELSPCIAYIRVVATELAMSKTNSLGVRVRIETKAALERFASRSGLNLSSAVEQLLLEQLFAVGEIPREEVEKPRRRYQPRRNKAVFVERMAA